METDIHNQKLQRARKIHSELQERYRVTQFEGLAVYIVDARIAPETMREIGRIREYEFRKEGGGTGRELDIDKYDTEEPRYKQIVAWDSENKEIVSMYRYIRGSVLAANAQFGGRQSAHVHLGRPTAVQSANLQSASANLFTFSPEFIKDYLPYTIELGRSVVNRQAKRRIKGLPAIWSGIGALAREYADTRYFFGKFTVSPAIAPEVRERLYAMLYAWRAAHTGLIVPRPEHAVRFDIGLWQKGGHFKEDLSRMNEIAAGYGQGIPPLVFSYARLSDSVQIFGTAVNRNFAGAEETAILIPVHSIKPNIRTKYIDAYTSTNPEAFL